MTDRGPLPALVHNVICGRKLESLRQRAGLTQEQVAKRLGASQSRVANIESGLNSLKLDQLRPFLDLYDADSASRQYCEHHATLGRKWSSHNQLRSRFEGKMRDHIDLEGSADTRWEHRSMVIPGLLQTEAYMRYLSRAYRPSLSPSQIDRDTEDRLARQQVLDNVSQRFWFIIDEAALRRMANMDGDSTIMREQIKHLAEAVDRPNIEVQAVPFSHGYYLGQAEDYVIFGYDTDTAVQVIYVEQYDGGTIVRDVGKVRRYVTLWEHQRAAALGPEQTRAFLAGMARSS
jgi:transcriptional regulator with XRE-family HTH domain